MLSTWSGFLLLTLNIFHIFFLVFLLLTLNKYMSAGQLLADFPVILCCAIWYHLCNFKNVKNTPPWVLYKCCQIAQNLISLPGSWLHLWGAGDHSFSTYVKFSKKLSYPLIHIRMCAFLGVRNVSFSESFTNVLNEWSLTSNSDCVNARKRKNKIANSDSIYFLIMILTYHYDSFLCTSSSFSVPNVLLGPTICIMTHTKQSITCLCSFSLIFKNFAELRLYLCHIMYLF